MLQDLSESYVDPQDPEFTKLEPIGPLDLYQNGVAHKNGIQCITPPLNQNFYMYDVSLEVSFDGERYRFVPGFYNQCSMFIIFIVFL